MNDLKEICRNYNKKQQAGLLEVGWDNQVGWAKNIIDVQLREAFKNKNDETFGIFHMLVDPPPRQRPKILRKFSLFSSEDGSRGGGVHKGKNKRV